MEADECEWDIYKKNSSIMRVFIYVFFIAKSVSVNTNTN